MKSGLKLLGFPLSHVVVFLLISQIANILFIRIWGTYSDKYSDETVLPICTPVYLMCILCWTFTTFPRQHLLTIPPLVVIQIGSGIVLLGINLSLSDIGLKLAPDRQSAVIFLSVRSLINASAYTVPAASIRPLIKHGGVSGHR